MAKSRTLVESAASAATAGAIVLGTTGNPTLAAVATTTALVRDVAKGFVGLFFQDLESRTAEWTKYVADPAMTAEDVQKRASEPAFRGVVIEHVRALATTIDPAVIPALGALAKNYIDAKRGVDPFFRGLTRVLSDLSEAQFCTLRRLTQVAVDLSGETISIRPNECSIRQRKLLDTVDADHVTHLLISNRLAQSALVIEPGNASRMSPIVGSIDPEYSDGVGRKIAHADWLVLERLGVEWARILDRESRTQTPDTRTTVVLDVPAGLSESARQYLVDVAKRRNQIGELAIDGIAADDRSISIRILTERLFPPAVS